ncbi:MAG TPA: hypothetical protein VGK64_08200 [Bryobacteraceae bacterium]
MSAAERKGESCGGRPKWLLPTFSLEFALALFLLFVGWRLAHTAKPSLSTEVRAFTRLAWVTRSGQAIDSIDLSGRYIMPRLNQTEHSILLTKVKPGETRIWSVSINNWQLHTPLPNNASAAFAVWSPDRDRFAFSRWNGDQAAIFEAAHQGSSIRLLFKVDDWSNISESWSPDGRWLAFTRRQAEKSQLWLLDVKIRKAHCLLESASALSEARFSPDGEYVALTRTAEGSDDVYMAPIDLTKDTPVLQESELIRISPDGGHSPEWGADSNELFYIGSDRVLMAWHRDSSAVNKLFAFSSIGSYRYISGGYCFVPERNAFIVSLELIVH